jgi:hypothetical protein
LKFSLTFLFGIAHFRVIVLDYLDYFLTPVGSTDSHDVSRYIVGQGRTYIQGDDKDPGNINVNEAIKSFLDGRVMVSFGLLTSIIVNDDYGPGDLVPAGGKVKVSVRVMGTRMDNG